MLKLDYDEMLTIFIVRLAVFSIILSILSFIILSLKSHISDSERLLIIILSGFLTLFVPIVWKRC